MSTTETEVLGAMAIEIAAQRRKDTRLVLGKTAPGDEGDPLPMDGETAKVAFDVITGPGPWTVVAIAEAIATHRRKADQTLLGMTAPNDTRPFAALDRRAAMAALEAYLDSTDA